MVSGLDFLNLKQSLYVAMLMTLALSCAFATSNQSHEHALVAERLGYQRAWFYDSPALYPDVWVQLCRAAERTNQIGLGPAVLVPSLRHPMTNAAAIATLVSIAGEERVAVTVGSGFTGRLTLGQRPLSWASVREYVAVVQGLLLGRRVRWQGKLVEMMHPPGYANPRPINVPFLIAAAGPKGVAAAKDLGAGVFTMQPLADDFAWNAVLLLGTVLAAGEPPGSDRAIAAAGHGASVALHFAMEYGREEALPNGKDWAAVYTAIPEEERHLALHDQHLIAVNDRDKPFVNGALLAAQGLALDAAQWRERLSAMEEAGATEVAYQPAGNDIPRELEAFAALLD